MVVRIVTMLFFSLQDIKFESCACLLSLTLFCLQKERRLFPLSNFLIAIFLFQLAIIFKRHVCPHNLHQLVIIFLTSRAEGRAVPVLATLGLHTPSLYWGSRVRWKAELAEPHSGISRLLHVPSYRLHLSPGSQGGPRCRGHLSSMMVPEVRDYDEDICVFQVYLE